MKQLRLAIEWWVLLVATVALAVFGQLGGLTERFDNLLLDTSAPLLRGQASGDIVIVEIDDEALGAEGAWPWPRSVHARLIDELAQAGSRVIVYDVLFFEARDGAGDAALADAMRSAGNVVLPYGFAPQPNAARGLVAQRPAALFAEAAAGTGHVSIVPDADGIVRRVALNLAERDRAYSHISLAAIEIAYGGHPYIQPLRSDAPQRGAVPFQSSGSYRTVSAAHVLEGQVPKDFLANKIVLVGATAQGMGDRYAVSQRQPDFVPGVEIIANVIDAQLANRVIATAPRWMIIATALTIPLALFLCFWAMPPRHGLTATLALIGTTAALPLIVLLTARTYLPTGSTAFALLCAYPLWTWRRLTLLSNFLDGEIRSLQRNRDEADKTGFDYLARQAQTLRSITQNLEGRFEFLQQVIEAAPDAIVVLDNRGAIRMLNERARTLFPVCQSGGGADLAEVFMLEHYRLDEKSGELRGEAGDAYLVARARLAASGQDDGDDNGEIVAFRDVSELRAREEAREQYLEFLSHDMRTPQVAIIGLAERMALEGQDANLLDRIVKQSRRTMALADDFVQLARIEQSELRLTDIELVAAAEEACDRFYGPAKTKSIALERDLPEEPIFVKADADMLGRMLDNLLSNAIKYSPEQSAVRVLISVSQTQDVQITVSDQGPGLPPERMKEPFARFGARRCGSGPSAGLGLAFVGRVVEKHGWTITVESQPGVGTAFRIAVPA